MLSRFSGIEYSTIYIYIQFDWYFYFKSNNGLIILLIHLVTIDFFFYCSRIIIMRIWVMYLVQSYINI